MFASVDINKANQNELVALLGVGVKKAREIVIYRKTNGCFKSIDDLIKVKGIDEKILYSQSANNLMEG